MKVLSIRFCTVSTEAGPMAKFFDALGVPSMDLSQYGIDPSMGSIFTAGDSWIEIWHQGPDMPPGTMLQVVVDDADAFAAHARGNGLDPQGPTDAHGEHIYYLTAPSGLQISFQSKLA